VAADRGAGPWAAGGHRSDRAPWVGRSPTDLNPPGSWEPGVPGNVQTLVKEQHSCLDQHGGCSEHS
jgi:hypothetical protein